MAVLPALRLYTSNASPYCLKVRVRLALVLPSRALVLIALARSQVMVLAHELGLTPHIELDYSVKAFPTTTHTPHSHLVPHGKIPALVVSSPGPPARESVLYGSENICAYLDELAGGKALPRHGSIERFEALTTESLASAIKDAALSLRYERLERVRPLLARLSDEAMLTCPCARSPKSSSGRTGSPVSCPRSPAASLFSRDADCRAPPTRCSVSTACVHRARHGQRSELTHDARLQIAAAVALWYVDRRAADSNWRKLDGNKELNEVRSLPLPLDRLSECAG